MSHRKLTDGFTLLEILLALFIFTLVSIILTQALHNMITNQATTEAKSLRFAELQTTLLLLTRDFEQTVSRPIINAHGKEEGFIGTPTSISFTHAGFSNPTGLVNRTTLQRTHYQLKNHTLMRVTWPVLDQTIETVPATRTLLTNVRQLNFEYLDSKQHFYSAWPPLNQPNTILPQAIRVSLVLADWGKITQFYWLAGPRNESQ